MDDIAQDHKARTGNTKREEATERIGMFFDLYVSTVKGQGMDDEQNFSDFLADIMHWADDRELSFESALATAQMHHDHETG